jgi:6-pyruvoyl tetrahydropterin synthase/QueD family protein
MKIDKSAIHFSAAHALVFDQYEEGLHGHNYIVEVKVKGSLDDDNIVIDFLELEQIVKKVALEMDHFVLLPTKNTKIRIKEKDMNLEIKYGNRYYSIPKNEVILVECSNVTTEILCQKFGEKIQEALKSRGYWSRIKKLNIIIWENPFYCACYELQ